MNTINKLIVISMTLSGCATMKDSALLGAGIGATSGALLGSAVGSNNGNQSQSTLVGAAIGAGTGALLGYLAHIGKEKKKQVSTSSQPKSDSNEPSLTSPIVRRIFVPSRIEGKKFIEGHYEFVIERESVWSE